MIMGRVDSFKLLAAGRPGPSSSGGTPTPCCHCDTEAGGQAEAAESRVTTMIRLPRLTSRTRRVGLSRRGATDSDVRVRVRLVTVSLRRLNHRVFTARSSEADLVGTYHQSHDLLAPAGSHRYIG